MFLLMTVNGKTQYYIIGYVCLTIALGSGIGHFIYYPLL